MGKVLTPGKGTTGPPRSLRTASVTFLYGMLLRRYGGIVYLRLPSKKVLDLMLIEKMLALAPRDRYQTYRALQDSPGTLTADRGTVVFLGGRHDTFETNGAVLNAFFVIESFAIA